MITWLWRSFDELTNHQLYDLLSLRQKVFIMEQHCVYDDTDYIDQKCQHLLGIQDNQLAAYLRLIPKDIAYENAISFGRVLTAPFARKQGLGKQMIDETFSYLKKIQNTDTIIISAQLYLEKFYQSYGFKTVGEPYNDAGILHIKMKKSGTHEQI